MRRSRWPGWCRAMRKKQLCTRKKPHRARAVDGTVAAARKRAKTSPPASSTSSRGDRPRRGARDRGRRCERRRGSTARRCASSAVVRTASAAAAGGDDRDQRGTDCAALRVTEAGDVERRDADQVERLGVPGADDRADEQRPGSAPAPPTAAKSDAAREPFAAHHGRLRSPCRRRMSSSSTSSSATRRLARPGRRRARRRSRAPARRARGRAGSRTAPAARPGARRAPAPRRRAARSGRAAPWPRCGAGGAGGWRSARDRPCRRPSASVTSSSSARISSRAAGQRLAQPLLLLAHGLEPGALAG